MKWRDIKATHCPSTGAFVMRINRLGGTALYCYWVIKVDRSCIPFFKWAESWCRVDFNKLVDCHCRALKVGSYFGLRTHRHILSLPQCSIPRVCLKNRSYLRIHTNNLYGYLLILSYWDIQIQLMNTHEWQKTSFGSHDPDPVDLDQLECFHIRLMTMSIMSDQFPEWPSFFVSLLTSRMKLRLSINRLYNTKTLIWRKWLLTLSA